ncbi:peptide ABC transporter permease [Enemella dayhoffiae]|uniref:Peptide ABC transporter permease n=1 Tax=Enemella dayhoffiae TaxID=2016507 RepID=A0A255H3W7_9ACTN|nr:ABC transporter permease [Enemella dayhoffiae]OYO22428.1 peptide ABC transporter permease [Enemella dayhoffiae]
MTEAQVTTDPTPADNHSSAADRPNAKPDKARSLWGDAWLELRRSPMFWIAALLIVIVVVMAIAPTLFTRVDPYYCDLNNSLKKPGQNGALFGYTLQGCDVFARTVHGARSSVLVGLLATIGTLVLGSLIGIVAGFFGGWLDVVLSRIGDIFFAIPLLLGGIIILYTFPNKLNTPYMVVVLKVVAAIVVLGWPTIARLMRSSVLQVKPTDYVQAGRALGAGAPRLIISHVLPNAFAPAVVVATINLGAYIATEATLSFLGIGLQPPVISWGVDISEASGIGYIAAAPHMLLVPSAFLSVTVLGFILLGESIRDALDPKLR